MSTEFRWVHLGWNNLETLDGRVFRVDPSPRHRVPFPAIYRRDTDGIEYAIGIRVDEDDAVWVLTSTHIGPNDVPLAELVEASAEQLGGKLLVSGRIGAVMISEEGGWPWAEPRLPDEEEQP